MKRTFWMLIVAWALLPACQNNASEQKKRKTDPRLMIAVAANVQYAMKDLASAFEQQHRIKIETNVSSSGKLTAQIQQGAPFDLFLSANMKYPQTLYEGGYAVDTPLVYAYGALVLWTLKDLEMNDEKTVLSAGNFEKLAIANPKNAPYGEQAIRMLEHYQLYEQVEPKLVYGESIAQTNQYIVSRACDLGVTAKSVVLSPDIQGRGRWVEIAAEAYEPIKQGVVITKYGQREHPEAAKAFLDFLFSPEAKAIFKKYGYTL